MVNIIDAFGEFKNILERNLNKSTEDKLQLWIEYYEKNYPELKEKCTCDYEKDGYNWREVGVNKVFNRVAEDFCFMIEAYENLLKVLKDIEERVIKVFHVEIDINIVLYSSLGHAAGWVDEYEGKRAIIFGFDGYVRPDHGRMIWGETGKPGYGLYDRALGAAYLTGIFEAVEKNK